MNVTRFEEYRSRDMVATLRDLLQRAEQHRLRGFAFVIKTAPRRHKFGVVGDYDGDPWDALAAVTRMEYKVNQLISAREDEPNTSPSPL